MASTQQIKDDLKDALRQRDRVRCSVLRLVLSAINNAEIAQQKTLDDTGVLGVLEKEVKQRRESIEAYAKGHREDLVAQEQAEMAILLEYLPKQMTREEIMAAARKAISEMGAAGPKDKGKVMSQLVPQLKGKAQGQEISAVVSELLGSG